MEPNETKSDEHAVGSTEKNTGLFHDDDGNVDDKRVAAWLTGVGIAYLVFQAVANGNQEALRLVEILIWPWMVLMGVTATEKLKPGIK